MVLNFDDRGTVTHRAILGETCTVLEMAAGTWHAVLSLDTGGIIFEENQEPRSLWPGMRKRRWATALLPSKAINKNGMSFPIPFPLLQTVGDDFSRRR